MFFDCYACVAAGIVRETQSIIYLNGGFTISPCLSFFNVLFLHVSAISYIAMVKNFFRFSNLILVVILRV